MELILSRATITVRYDSEASASAIANALAPENDAFIEARASGTELRASTSAASPGALLHTLDDFLASLAAAEAMVEPRQGPRPRILAEGLPPSEPEDGDDPGDVG
ncbi:MAG: KEOPS complex subunit Pcc1 [Thermoplasmatota archaeon]